MATAYSRGPRLTQYRSLGRHSSFVSMVKDTCTCWVPLQSRSTVKKAPGWACAPSTTADVTVPGMRMPNGKRAGLSVVTV